MKIHIEIGQYQFIEAEADSVEELKDIYDDVKRTFNEGSGISEVVFGKLRAKYKRDGTLSTDDLELYEQCDFCQKKRLSDIKKDLGTSKGQIL